MFNAQTTSYRTIFYLKFKITGKSPETPLSAFELSTFFIEPFLQEHAKTASRRSRSSDMYNKDNTDTDTDTAILTNGDFTAYVCDSAATRPSSQITLGKFVHLLTFTFTYKIVREAANKYSPSD